VSSCVIVELDRSNNIATDVQLKLHLHQQVCDVGRVKATSWEKIVCETFFVT